MPREFTRAERVADALQRELALLIREEMGDPRVNFVNITAVDVSESTEWCFRLFTHEACQTHAAAHCAQFDIYLRRQWAPWPGIVSFDRYGTGSRQAQ
mgnify:CR=1 FL=1